MSSQKYGDRIFGYFLLCGHTTEWFSEYDYESESEDKIKAFIKEELPDDEICSYCEIFDINGIDLKRKLQSLLEKE